MKKRILHFTKTSDNYYSLVVKFKNLLKRVELLFKTGLSEEYSTKRQNRLLTKLRNYYQKLSTFNPSYALKLAGATICFALIAGTAQAATPKFDTWADSPLSFTTINGRDTYTIVDVAFADLDGDDDLDAAVLYNDDDAGVYGGIAFMENVDGDYVENIDSKIFSNFGSHELAFIDIADYDNDGYPEILLRENDGSGFLYFYKQNSADGIFTYSSGSYSYQYTGAKFMDVDEDGDLDVITIAVTWGEFATIVLENDNGTLRNSGSSPFTLPTNYDPSYSQIAVADIDNDGDDDFFIFSTTGTFSTYYENEGNGSFSNGIINTSKLPLENMSTSLLTFLADLDGDGDTDVFQTGSASSETQIAFENITGKYNISWENPSNITYGTALCATQLNASADIEGTFTYEPALETVLNAGEQSITATFTPDDTETYKSTTQTVSIIVNKALLTATADNQTIEQNGVLPVFTISYSGFVNSEEYELDTPPTASVSITNTSTVGTFAITATGGSDSNYDFSHIPGTLTITLPTGITDITKDELKVYPNPANDIINIDGTQGLATLYNFAGKIVLTHDLSNGNSIDISSIAKGIYILCFNGKNVKIIKQ